MIPKYPIYIVSKGRWEARLTSRALESMGVPYFIVVEEQEFDNYSRVISRERVIVLDVAYQRDYQTYDNLGDTKSKGPGAARNFAWDHSIRAGFGRHWVMDDNLRCFGRLYKNKVITCKSGAIFVAMEDFVDRYDNVAMAGPQDYAFANSSKRQGPLKMNTRIYSCNLIKNDTPYRWRGRYNEDTDLSLRMLKDGWCTILFYAFLMDKKTTSPRQAGGNTDAFYAQEGYLPKSNMQVKLHPDVSKLVWKWNRWHHHVDYRPFKNNRLVKKKGIEIPEGVNNYGMKLVKVGEENS